MKRQGIQKPATTTAPETWHAESTINEPNLVVAGANNTVEHVRIVKREHEYFVFVKLIWCDQEFILVTYRKKPRAFKHLGRLIDHLTELIPSVPSMEIQIHPSFRICVPCESV